MRKAALGILAVLLIGPTGLRLQAEDFVLASAQVVESTDRAPVLRLIASGPIAFEMAPPDPAEPREAGGVVLRLYGVRPAPHFSPGGLAPFSLIVTPLKDGCRIVVSVAGGGAPGRLTARAGARASEVEVRSIEP